MLGDTHPGSVPPCPTCRNPVDVKSRHVVVRGSTVQVYCSETCKTGRHELRREPRPPALAPKKPIALIGAARRRRRAGVRGSSSGRAASAGWRPPRWPRSSARAPASAAPANGAPAVDPSIAEAKASEDRWIAELAMDAWIHPLAGPTRRMPIRDSRVFGAERPGDRPGECGSGHCGVDIGGEIWGEPVMAVHDGVVARVQRDPNPHRGGHYVKLSHRGGTVFTYYFHLAAMPSWLEEGDEVKMGRGDRPARRHRRHQLGAAPPLRAVGEGERRSKEPEQYIDPEVLIALWPLKVPPGPGERSALALSSPGPIRGPFVGRRKKARGLEAGAGEVEQDRGGERGRGRDARPGRDRDVGERAVGGAGRGQALRPDRPRRQAVGVRPTANSTGWPLETAAVAV